MADFEILFNGYDLNLIPNLEFVKRNPNEESSIDITDHELVRQDGAIITNVRHASKNINLLGYIIAPSRTSFEEALDTLKYRTSGIEKELKLIQSGSERVYTATKKILTVSHLSDGKAEIELVFICSDPRGRASTLVTESLENTASTYSIPHTFLGTTSATPVFTITLNTITGGTTKNISIGNARTGQSVTYSDTFTNGDIIQFNCETKKVFFNSVSSDYNGIFPEFEANQSHAVYTDDLTTRNVTIDITYAPRYL